MTLFKQIALLVSTIFLLLACIFFISDFNRTSRFLQGQLQTTAQDMATTLGVAVSNLPDARDQATLEVLFNAVFDSGYYSGIELIGVDGQTIHQKSQTLDVEGVPDWFLRLVPLTSAKGSTQVMNGWSQLGRLNLEIHPGFAYSNLYNSLITTLGWFALLFILSMSVLWIVLRIILRPLQRVKDQADAIHGNKFVQQRKIPNTIELKRVVEAMNLMVSKVQAIFNDQEKTLAQYQQLLNRDKLTNLGNRRYLLEQLQQSMSEESGMHGSMAIIKVENYDAIRERHGYEVSDNLIRITADLLRQDHAGHRADKVSRFNDDEFAFLLASDEATLDDFLLSIFDQFRRLSDSEPDLQDSSLLAGSCALETGKETGALLSSIDYCLSQAGNNGPYSIERSSSSTGDLPQGKMQWRSWLDSVIDSKRLFLVGQLALDSNQKAVQRELFIRAKDLDGKVIPASAFMPMASSLGMSLDIDKAVFSLVSENRHFDHEVPLALNLSAAFFELVEGQEEFDQLLINCQENGIKLCLEASHNIFEHHPIMAAKVSERVRRHGHQFGIDNLDLGLSLQLLQTAQFDYVKINAKTLHEMSNSDSPAGFQALKTITDTLDIRIIAVAVDSQKIFDELGALGIDVMQGNFLNSPEPV